MTMKPLTAPNYIKTAITNAQYDWLYQRAPIDFRGRKNLAAAIRNLIDDARRADKVGASQ